MHTNRWKTGGRQALSARRFHIWLVEDDPADAALTQRAVQKTGIDHEIHLATDSAQVARFARHAGRTGNPPWPDLILLDVHLPGKNGYEVLQSLRAHPECSNIPVIAMSGISGDPEIARLEELPLVGFFTKATDLKGYMRLGPLVLDVLANVADHRESAAAAS